MGLQLNLEKKLSEEIKMVICEECKNAIAQITNKEGDCHQVVHEVRKSFKKIRAALRLIRYKIPFYKEENKVFRNLGRLIAGLRDSMAVIEAFDSVTGKYGSKIHSSTFSAFRKELFIKRDFLTKEHIHRQRRLEMIKEELLTQQEEIGSWKIDVSDFADIENGLKTVYKRGVKGLAEAKTEGRNKDFHEWRKRTKYLGYQLEMLGAIWEKYLARMVKELKILADYLGVDHDLSILNQMISEGNVDFRDSTSEDLFLALTKKEKETLQKKALLKGTKLYLDSTAEFCNKMETYWMTYQQEKIDSKMIE